MTNADVYPSVPDDRLTEGGWKLQSKMAETVFELSAVSVTGYTLVYEDSRLREAIEAVGIDGGATTVGAEHRGLGTETDSVSRFFFATALSFRPPLPPGIGPASLRPTVERRGREEFTDELRARGFETIESERNQRLRTESGDRAHLRKLTATLPLDSGELPEGLDIEGWLAVWMTGGSFRIAGGAYPTGGLQTAVDSNAGVDRDAIDPSRFRAELLSLIRSVR